MPTPSKVCHVVLSMECGGLERVVLDLVREGRKLGQQVSVLCLERTGELAPALEKLGVPVTCLCKPPGIWLRTIRDIRAQLEDIGPEVVHTHQIGALFYAGPAARHASVPVIVHTEHGKHFRQRLRTRLLGKIAGRSASRYLCVSADIAAEVLACRIVPQSKLAVVPNGVDTARFGHGEDSSALRETLGIPTGARVIGTVGRLTEIKRQDLLIRAWARLASRWPGLHLLLVGDGPLQGELRALASAVGLADRIHFAGYQSEPQRFYHLMDVFALTSRSEGLPLAVLEAWAAGVPVVASRVGGLPELIRQEQTGLLFDSGDETALAAALDRLLTDEALAEVLRASARSRVESDFGLRRMALEYQRHYGEVFEVAMHPICV